MENHSRRTSGLVYILLDSQGSSGNPSGPGGQETNFQIEGLPEVEEYHYCGGGYCYSLQYWIYLHGGKENARGGVEIPVVLQRGCVVCVLFPYYLLDYCRSLLNC